MKAATYRGPGDVRIEEHSAPEIEESTDAVIRITHTAICGSDLWFYRGQEDYDEGAPVGHEPMGIVEKVGDDIRHVEPGDRVFAGFAISCGECEFCRKGLHTACTNGGFWDGPGVGGAQAEKLRVPHANGTLVRVPDRYANDEDTLEALLPLTDVMGTGHHAAVCADVEAGDTAVVIGDGAVGLCAVLASKRLGAERIIAVGHHEDRLELAEEFGATETVSSRGQEAIDEIQDITYGGANHVLECVGAESSLETAATVARPGGSIGYVGVPHVEDPSFLEPLFFSNASFTGGPAPTRAYAEELMEDVLQGTLDPSPIFTKTVDLDGVPEGYEAMDEREAVKVMVKVDA
ncbi:zinc-dependent alcohol dehydrogenase family protein [Natrinema versiforme]|uniref:Zinc-dependent alcohol dehydrogenase family protein n=1 Tax=Natrinema versiforme TaxID=88724 RepID=A0A4P8WR19_9EURY|nr:zinc-dependent alcohol dehydrogenase family protein [Natrinema versiforme]QCS44591.1 zinc-dependent alcohol dehydrogenase family protein [Natrinema versiforme]